MTSPQQQVIDKVNEVIAVVKDTYAIDISAIQVKFNLKGRAAGRASGKNYRDVAENYIVQFNATLVSNPETLQVILDDVVPHEIAHVICFMNPLFGQDHDYGWKRVCIAIGGSGERTHSMPVIYAKGSTYEYTTHAGKTIRISQKRHNSIRRGKTYNFIDYGKIDLRCNYKVVGANGFEFKSPVDPNATQASVAASGWSIEHMRDRAPAKPVQRDASKFVGEKQASKVSITRALMMQAIMRGEPKEITIQKMIDINGYSRGLAMSTYSTQYDNVLNMIREVKGLQTI